MTTIQLTNNKKTITLEIQQLIIYKQAKIIEATNNQNQYYSIIFYKDRFINAKKTSSIRLQSFLRTALTNGYTFSGDHPLIKALLSGDKSFRLTTNNQMVTKLQDKYNDIEMLYILAMFDNFLDEKKIQALCRKTFYQYRRNGQVFKAFRILINFVQIRPPHDKFAQDMLHHFDFQKFSDQYKDIDQLTKKWSDPLYLESVFFEQGFPKVSINPLLQQYHIDNRKFDQLSLYFLNDSQMDDLTKLSNLAKELLTEKGQVQLWELLLKEQQNSEQIIKKLVELNSYTAILNYYLNNPQSNIDLKLLKEALEQIPSHELIENYQQLLSILTTSFKNDSAQLDKVLHVAIKKLLKHLSLPDILESLSDTELPIIKKIKKMEQLSDNPDKQLALGEIYYNLELYDQAITCFEWEMELSPNNPAPINYLYKCYQAKGDKEQANTYRQLMANIPS
ncbi:hypothetical protein JCM21714_4547 [Gracilibacillus boraciitolerans JCM 21714]|uniref:Uncharacterized protein n=1 Tax=Gracilibacillus boraciitolerans JCM 21714 TaxID=1298598 RepID=W4VQ27_9BACI|nr:hypothetical protein [Gracilibacillus boraciitolerans]GAE95322.1 hypothetical protein JCM21714_4547 [Gracilibacillus boraciitolerans JCM 21714]